LVDEDSFSENIDKKFKLKKYVIKIIFTLLIVILNGFSAVYLGIHSFDQVLLGLAYGLYLMTLYILIFDSKIGLLLQNLVEKKY
jgi:membrane-associated phospholipid phosphatase